MYISAASRLLKTVLSSVHHHIWRENNLLCTDHHALPWSSINQWCADFRRYLTTSCSEYILREGQHQGGTFELSRAAPGDLVSGGRLHSRCSSREADRRVRLCQTALRARQVRGNAGTPGAGFKPSWYVWWTDTAISTSFAFGSIKNTAAVT